MNAKKYQISEEKHRDSRFAQLPFGFPHNFNINVKKLFHFIVCSSRNSSFLRKIS